jgi:MFS family permease
MTEAGNARQGWTVVALLTIFMMINTADRAALGLAGPAIIRDLNLTNTEFGFVGSSFFFLYSLSAILVGFISNRVSTRSTLLVLVVVWSIAQAPLAGAVTLPILIASRIVLGAGEGPGYPVALHGVYKWFPDERRAFPTALIAQGATLGVVVILPILNAIMLEWSWHAVFAVLTAMGLVWAMFWIALGQEGPLDREAVATIADRRPYLELLTDRTTIAVWIIGFGAFWGYSLLITWFSSYLTKGLDVPPNLLGLYTALPWLVSTVVILAVGALSQALLRSGVSSRYARFYLGLFCVLAGGLSVTAAPFAASAEIKLAMLIGGIALPVVVLSLIPPIISEYVPAAQRGAMLAIGQAIVTFAGVLAPAITGLIVDRGAEAVGFDEGFTLCGIVMTAGALIGGMVIAPRSRLAVAGAR